MLLYALGSAVLISLLNVQSAFNASAAETHGVPMHVQ
jgi:hypothetical protein